MPSVIYDAETGTVVDASNVLLVDVDAMNEKMGVTGSDVLLSEEDADAQAAASEVGIPVNTVYVVACTGGLEEPSFESHLSFADAEARFNAYKQDMLRDPGDCVHFLKSENGVMTTVDSVSYN